MGLNTCPPFTCLPTIDSTFVLPPARTVVEDEMRRNAFWLAYTQERHFACANSWALSLDNQDISQLLPVRKDQFEAMVNVPSINFHNVYTVSDFGHTT